MFLPLPSHIATSHHNLSISVHPSSIFSTQFRFYELFLRTVFVYIINIF